MMNLKSRILAGASSLGFVALASAAHADALPSPSMSGPLTLNANPFSVDLPDWLGDGGKVYVGGAVSGLVYAQSNSNRTGFGDADTFADLSNGMVWIEKNDGWLQFFAAAGGYSFPTVGIPYTDASATENFTFGYIPVAYAKIVGQGDWSSFSIEAGKLPTLIGNEYAFTFQNMNIERGLVWNFEPLISRGVQANYSSGPLTISVSWNDGAYSGVLNQVSGLVSYAMNGGADTVSFTAGGQVGGNFHYFGRLGYATSILNSGSVYDLIWTHTSGPWTISPYFQINATPDGTPMYAGAVLASYSFDDNWKLAGRVEYVSASHGFNPMLETYGNGANAVTVTVTPTYQWKAFYGRVDLSYVSIGGNGSGFGPLFNKTDQFRAILEAGVLF